MVETLSDLVFHLREVAGGRPRLLSIDRHRRREVLSTSDFLGAIHSLALALERRGLAGGERVAIFAENCPEWHVIDFACQLLGIVTVPLYPTLASGQIAYILRNSGCRWVFYSDAGKRDLLLGLASALPGLPQLVALETEAAAPGGLALTPLLGEGAAERTAIPLEHLRGRPRPESLASLIYTSGTTGEPKGVMLSHRNLVSNFLACAEVFRVGAEDLALSFLPLSHVFERTVDHLLFYRGVPIHYVPAVERVPPALLEVRPTVLPSIPRLYERAFVKIRSNLAKESPARRRLFDWAVAVGREYLQAHQRGFVGPLLWAKRALAQQLVYRKVQARLGGRLRLAISGGAPLGREIDDFFAAVGAPIYQGYGLTETSPVLTANRPGAYRLGSAGRAIPGVELRIARDGEILAKSPGVMQGYWENAAATAEVFDSEGWFHTGDIGHLDRDGFLFITDRKKDLLVTSGGKNIAPQPIEQALTASGLLAQAVVVGDRYPYPVALLVPAFDALAAELGGLGPAELVDHPAVRERVTALVDLVNRGLAEHERIRRWRLLPRELTLERAELTPTLKVRRRMVVEHYAEEIAGLYLKTQRVEE